MGRFRCLAACRLGDDAAGVRCWIPADAGMTVVGAGMTPAGARLWIPAAGGMTTAGVGITPAGAAMAGWWQRRLGLRASQPWAG